MTPAKLAKEVIGEAIIGEAISFSVETHTAMHNSKNVARVVLVNERGERILDTLVAPQKEEVALKAGLKSQLFKLS